MTNDKLITFAKKVIKIIDIPNPFPYDEETRKIWEKIEIERLRYIREIAKKELAIQWHPIPSYCTLMTLQEFKKCVDQGAFTSDDGSGMYASATQESDEPYHFYDTGEPINPAFTHVCWYNK